MQNHRLPEKGVLEITYCGISLVVQWLRLHASTAWGMGSILDWGTNIPHALCPTKKKEKERLTQNTNKKN